MKHVILASKFRLIFALVLASSALVFAEEVELKFVVKEAGIPKALRKFTQGIRAEERNIYFLETDKRALSRRGIILRLRETSGKRDESTVKLRGKVAADLPDAEFPLTNTKEEESKMELDKVIGGTEARSFSITVKQRKGEIADVRKGKRELKALFSDKQENQLHEYADGIDWQRARLLGPVKSERWKLKANGFPYELVAELWHLPSCGEKEMLEFSTKVDETKARVAERDLLRLMREKEVVPSMTPDSKTAAVLKCLLRR